MQLCLRYPRTGLRVVKRMQKDKQLLGEILRGKHIELGSEVDRLGFRSTSRQRYCECWHVREAEMVMHLTSEEISPVFQCMPSTSNQLHKPGKTWKQLPYISFLPQSTSILSLISTESPSKITLKSAFSHHLSSEEPNLCHFLLCLHHQNSLLIGLFVSITPLFNSTYNRHAIQILSFLPLKPFNSFPSLSISHIFNRSHRAGSDPAAKPPAFSVPSFHTFTSSVSFQGQFKHLFLRQIFLAISRLSHTLSHTLMKKYTTNLY